MGPILALVSLTSFGGPSAPNFEVLGLDLKYGQITAVHLSPNGRFILATSGTPFSRTAFLFRQNEPQEISLPHPDNSPVEPMFVDNGGGVIVDYCAPARNGTVERAFRVDAGSTVGIPVGFGDRSMISFRPEGMGRDGEVFGNLVGIDPLNNLGAAAYWKRDRMTNVWTSTGYLMTSAVAGSNLGVVGTMPHVVAMSAHNLLSADTLPVLFHPGEGVEYLPLPRYFYVGRPTTCSSDGSVIFGSVGPNGDKASGVVWLNGAVNLLPKLALGVDMEEITAVTPDGSLGVGTAIMKPRNFGIVWTRESGLCRIEDFLKSRQVEIPKEWKIVGLVGVSPDGKFILGNAEGRRGLTRPVRITLPSPDSAKKDGD